MKTEVDDGLITGPGERGQFFLRGLAAGRKACAGVKEVVYAENLRSFRELERLMLTHCKASSPRGRIIFAKPMRENRDGGRALT